MIQGEISEELPAAAQNVVSTIPLVGDTRGMERRKSHKTGSEDNPWERPLKPVGEPFLR
jgi:hypothetical protein